MEALGPYGGRNRKKKCFEVRMCKEGQHGGQCGRSVDMKSHRKQGQRGNELFMQGVVSHCKDSSVFAEWDAKL